MDQDVLLPKASEEVAQRSIQGIWNEIDEIDEMVVLKLGQGSQGGSYHDSNLGSYQRAIGFYRR